MKAPVPTATACITSPTEPHMSVLGRECTGWQEFLANARQATIRILTQLTYIEYRYPSEAPLVRYLSDCMRDRQQTLRCIESAIDQAYELWQQFLSSGGLDSRIQERLTQLHALLHPLIDEMRRDFDEVEAEYGELITAYYQRATPIN